MTRLKNNAPYPDRRVDVNEIPEEQAVLVHAGWQKIV